MHQDFDELFTLSRDYSESIKEVKEDATKKKMILKQLENINGNEEENSEQILQSLMNDFVQNKRWEMYMSSKTANEDWNDLFEKL